MKKAERMLGLIVLLVTALGTMITGKEYLQTQGEEVETRGVIVIDPGHGGKDPGKVGCHNEIEKDINLAIALMIEKHLLEEGYEVVLTRSTDTTATGEYDSVKQQDMQARVNIINESDPLCCVSIHQNSYGSSGVSGAQVFFYPGSEEGCKLAEILQRYLIEKVDPENDRKIKAEDSYYVLKNTTCPIVIVECGFLSDERESVRLNSVEYQEVLAGAIAEGIVEYLDIE